MFLKGAKILKKSHFKISKYLKNKIKVFLLSIYEKNIQISKKVPKILKTLKISTNFVIREQ